MDAKAAVQAANDELLDKLRQRVVDEARSLVQFLYESKNAVFRAGEEIHINDVARPQVAWPLLVNDVATIALGITENGEIVISRLLTKGLVFPRPYWSGYELMDISVEDQRMCLTILSCFDDVRRSE